MRTFPHTLAGALVASLLLAFNPSPAAEELVLTNGQTLRDVVVLQVDGPMVVIREAGATNRIALADLAEPDRHRIQEAELRRKAEDVQRLRRELERQEKELRQLEQATGGAAVTRPSTGTPAAAAVPATAPEPGSGASVVAVPLPDVQPDDHLSARDLGAFFRANPETALEHFKGKTFVLEGRVIGFSPAFMLRRYGVLLDSGDAANPLAVQFGYASDWDSVYATNGGKELIARKQNSMITLARKNQNVVLRVRCRSFKDDQVVTTALEPIR